MPLRTLQPDPSVTDRIAVEVLGMAPPSGAQALALGGSEDRALGVAAPHPVFNLGLDALGSPDWTQRVEMTGWRYFVTSHGDVIAAAEASTASANGPVQGTMTNEGPFVAGTEKALAQVESLPTVAKGTFALGLLRVPALYVVALWLRGEGQSAGTDWLVPVAPAPHPLRVDVLTRPKDFMDALVVLKNRRTYASAGAAASPSN
jgi:hypothetical protein